METGPSGLMIVVRPGSRTRSILAWLRQLLPAALLVVAAANLPVRPDAVVLDEEEVASGPLSLADALLRNRRSGTGLPTVASGTGTSDGI
jgi:hypothetical protein